MAQPTITGTTHTLPFEKLSSRDFERLCLWLVEREGYKRAEHLGAAGGDQGCDIVAWRGGQLWAFQCKRVQRFGPTSALAEVGKVLTLPKAERPAGLVFLVTCNVSANTRRQVRKRCGEQIRCQFWAGTELDEKVKRHSDIVDEFFRVDRGGGAGPTRWHSATQHVVEAAPDIVDTQRESYLARLTKEHTFLEMIGTRRSIPFLDIFVTVGLISHTSSTANLRQAADTSIQELIQATCVLLLGDPGAGKTTLLRYLALLHAKEYQQRNLLPILLRLPDLLDYFGHEDAPLERYLMHHYPAEGTLLRQGLHNGQCLVLYDGLDETPRTQWNRIRDDINRIRRWGNHVVITCRTAAYLSPFLDSAFRTFTIAKLSREQQRQFVERFFAEAPEKVTPLLRAISLNFVGYFEQHDSAWALVDRCIREPRSGFRVRDVLQVPLLLSLVVVLHDNGLLNLPIRRVDLYREMTSFLARRWSESRVPGSAQFDSADKLRLLEGIAFDCFRTGRDVFEEEDVLCRIRHWQEQCGRFPEGTREELLEEFTVHDGLLVRHGDTGLRFLHLTFQEYLAARRLAADQRLVKTVVSSVVRDHRWREVLLLAAQLVPNADHLLLAIAEVANEAPEAPKVRHLLSCIDKLVCRSGTTGGSTRQRANVIAHIADVAEAMRAATYAEDGPTWFYGVRYTEETMYVGACRDEGYIEDLGAIVRMASYISEATGDWRGEDLYPPLIRSTVLQINDGNDCVQPRDIAYARQILGHFDSVGGLGGFEWSPLDKLLSDLEAEAEKGWPGDKESRKARLDRAYEAWLYALHLTPASVDLDASELHALRVYLESVLFLIRCKESASQASPATWEKLESSLLRVDHAAE